MRSFSASNGKEQQLREIRHFIQLSEYLANERGWPLEFEQFEREELDMDRLTFDWDADELGIDAAKLRNLEEVRQMRPLTPDQPWGVFFLRFGGERLPRTELRLLLKALVIKKRGTRSGGPGGMADRPQWHLDDLLFIALTGSGETLAWHFVAFRGADARTAELRELAWRPSQEPDKHLQLLDRELLPSLDWPGDTGDRDGWRRRWRSGMAPLGQAITDAARLTDRMARTARDLRDQIEEALAGERGEGPFSTLMERIKEQLVSDVTPDSFADMCAQTLVYGLLASRMTDDDFGSSPVFSTVPLANPFLQQFFAEVHEEAKSLDLHGSDLPQFAADLAETDVKSILARFGNTAKGGDPVIHFYEEFLKAYDKDMRVKAGAFYTPQPAVEFMVRAVEEVLRSDFRLPLGVADPTSWREVAERNGFAVPQGVDPDSPFISMIDPATGTGTFLVEWLRQARRSFENTAGGGGGGLGWSEHLHEHVLPGMHAFELMLAPYTIAHLKVALELDEGHPLEDSRNSAQIHLTNTLEHPSGQGQLEPMSDPVAAEGKRAAALKHSERFSVVIGNPPYARVRTDRRKGGVVVCGTDDIPPLLESIAEPMRAAGQGVHVKNIHNLYVYFWRWAVWQATELQSGPGVVAFITASSYLDGEAMGGVRHLLRNAFDKLWLVDLGGEGRGARTEENIFDIQTAVAIGVGVHKGRDIDVQKTPRRPGDAECEVRYLKIEGTREEKLDRLRRLALDEVSEKVAGSGLDVLTPRSDSEYYEWPELTRLFPWIYSGCQVKRLWPIGETKAVLRQRWKDLLSAVPRRRAALFRGTRDRTIASTPTALLSSGRLRSVQDLESGDTPEGIERYGYRSFDRQWIIADNRAIDYPRPSLWGVRGSVQNFVTTLTASKLGEGPVLTVTPYVPDLCHFSNRGAKDTIPLYRDTLGQTPNVTEGLLGVLTDRIGASVRCEDLLAYVYALGGTPAFSNRFDDVLAEAAGPVHVPITSDSDLFEVTVLLGRELLWWHTWGERFAPEAQARLPVGSVREIEPVTRMPDEFDYDHESQTLRVGDGAFGPVSAEAWRFEVSGLRVMRSWLGYRMTNRKGRKSSPLDDIRPSTWTQSGELLLLISILEKTIELTPKAAELLEEIVAGPLIPASELPTPTAAERKPPKFPR